MIFLLKCEIMYLSLYSKSIQTYLTSNQLHKWVPTLSKEWYSKKYFFVVNCILRQCTIPLFIVRVQIMVGYPMQYGTK